ncbi:MAG: hypothetical protein HKN60_06365 [Rhizobiales bacterium]|nr:hypothetical protein [Hyphomicrobiales bacterium]
MRQFVKSSMAVVGLAFVLAAPANADPVGKGVDAVGNAAGRAVQALTGFRPATPNGLILYSGRASGPLRIVAIGDMSTNDRWRCGATVDGARLYSTGFTETSARQKLLPYTNTRFNCRRLERGSLLDD